ncbi:cell division control protein 42 -like [Asbolus verrucosus]|uniref:Cell division control protein 42-like n=1 Tax=Asbolus verrucosus TaxID=1661398 RepID=A0A482W280_ASBVE|nr:cell division control protein 42 -like [Asbolus verrucosus]
MSENIIKCVAVGDGFVGKTTLLARLCKKECDKEYNPTIFDNHSISSVYNGQTYDIILIDTAGQEGYSMLRKQMQESADIFLLCFSVSSTDSFSNVKEVWLPEVEAYPSASKILIGTKSDLRNDPETVDKLNASGAIFVSNSQAMNFAQSHNMKYVECSSAAQTMFQKKSH